MEFSRLCLSYMANDGGLASTADVKSLHRKRRIRIRDFDKRYWNDQLAGTPCFPMFAGPCCDTFGAPAS
jgi:hypothetical protein